MSGHDITRAWRRVSDEVEAACVRAGRVRSDVTLVAVSKMQPASAVIAAAAAGATDFGENYAQELVAKREAVAAQQVSVRWHFIGALQRNKAKLVIGTTLIHAIDSLPLLQEIGRRAVAAGVVQDVLVAVNLSGETSKSGTSAAQVRDVALADVAGVRVRGLMTMPAPGDLAAARHAFASLRRLRDDLGAARLPYLSMGMSHDFAEAIAEGATHVRIGTAIFGPRGP